MRVKNIGEIVRIRKMRRSGKGVLGMNVFYFVFFTLLFSNFISSTLLLFDIFDSSVLLIFNGIINEHFCWIFTILMNTGVSMDDIMNPKEIPSNLVKREADMEAIIKYNTSLKGRRRKRAREEQTMKLRKETIHEVCLNIYFYWQ